MSQSKDRPKHVPGKCNGLKKDGGLCREPAGKGTEHVGVGPCSRHGGCLPNVVKHHARQQAHQFVVGQLGYELDIDPLEGSLMAIRMAAGAAKFWEGQAAEAYRANKQPSAMVIEGMRQSANDLANMCAKAQTAGVADRLVSLAERAGEEIALMCEAGIAALAALGVALTNEQRTAFARAVQGAGEGFESGPELRLLTTGEEKG